MKARKAEGYYQGMVAGTTRQLAARLAHGCPECLEFSVRAIRQVRRDIQASRPDRKFEIGQLLTLELVGWETLRHIQKTAPRFPPLPEEHGIEPQGKGPGYIK